MKNDLKILAATLEKKFGKAHIEHDKKEEHHKAKVLHKVWDILKGKEKPSVQTLNRLALLAGSRAGQIFRAHCMAPTMGW